MLSSIGTHQYHSAYMMETLVLRSLATRIRTQGCVVFNPTFLYCYTRSLLHTTAASRSAEHPTHTFPDRKQ